MPTLTWELKDSKSCEGCPARHEYQKPEKWDIGFDSFCVCGAKYFEAFDTYDGTKTMPRPQACIDELDE
jgi:hypothetical protein